MNTKKILISVLIIIVCLIAYFIYRGQTPNFEGVFTTYEPLPYDSISVSSDKNNISSKDTIALPVDSLNNNTSQLDTTVTDEKESIFHVNTSYDKIPDAQLSEEKLKMVTQHQADDELFQELLLSDEDDKETLDLAFRDNKIPYHSILKLLTIAGQDILIRENNHMSQRIVDAMGDSEQVFVIHIVDRKNNIVYSSHKTLANSTLLSSLNELDFESNNLEVSEVDGHTWISIPIFHTYGKVGHVLINLVK